MRTKWWSQLINWRSTTTVPRPVQFNPSRTDLEGAQDNETMRLRDFLRVVPAVDRCCSCLSWWKMQLWPQLRNDSCCSWCDSEWSWPVSTFLNLWLSSSSLEASRSAKNGIISSEFCLLKITPSLSPLSSIVSEKREAIPFENKCQERWGELLWEVPIIFLWFWRENYELRLLFLRCSLLWECWSTLFIFIYFLWKYLYLGFLCAQKKEKNIMIHLTYFEYLCPEAPPEMVTYLPYIKRKFKWPTNLNDLHCKHRVVKWILSYSGWSINGRWNVNNMKHNSWFMIQLYLM